MIDFDAALQKAVNFFGSNVEMAKALNVCSPTISYWKNGIQKVNYEKVILIEHLTKGLVTRHELAPDKKELNKLIEVKY